MAMDPIEPDFEAIEILKKAGCLEECEAHQGNIFEGYSDIESAYKLANLMVSQGRIKLPNGKTRRDLTDRLLETYQEYNIATTCHECARHGLHLSNFSR